MAKVITWTRKGQVMSNFDECLSHVDFCRKRKLIRRGTNLTWRWRSRLREAVNNSLVPAFLFGHWFLIWTSATSVSRTMCDTTSDSLLRRKALKLKIQLKNWEKSFQKVNEKKPDRDDIKRAGPDVQEMYKRYWFYKSNPGEEYPDSKSGSGRKETVPKQSTSGVSFFEDSILTEKAKITGSQDVGDSIMKGLRKSFKSNKKLLVKNSSKKNSKEVPVLEIIPESPRKDGQQESVPQMELDTSIDTPKENSQSTENQRSEFIRKIFHGEDGQQPYEEEKKEVVDESKLNAMFDGCELLPVNWKPKAPAKRRVTSKKKISRKFHQIGHETQVIRF